jgi:hypothetical protein
MPAEIKSTRSQFVALYEKKFPLYVASTKPYISTVAFFLDVVDAFPAGAATMAHAVLRKQTVSWFSYGEGANQINQGPGVPQKAPNLADTNLNTAKVTNGAEDFIVEGISATLKAKRILWAAASQPAVADPDVQDAYNGKIKVKDPGALMSPPQFDSPTNLEDELIAMISNQTSVTLNFDKRGTIEVGRLDQIPEGAAKNVLQANGVAAVENRFRVPEGYIWRKSPKPDSQLYVTGRVEDAAVLAITAVGLGGAAAPLVLPTRIFADVTMRLHGVGLSLPSANVS